MTTHPRSTILYGTVLRFSEEARARLETRNRKFEVTCHGKASEAGVRERSEVNH
jgi:hypothetical protein